jgi:4'-phosphopantetheinyl transferase EntD
MDRWTKNDPLRSQLGRLFGPEVSICVATPNMPDMPLYPEEQVAISYAVPKRRREFTAGRIAARTALCTLGMPACPIPVGPHRAPQWPVGVVGSISHCDGFCLAVVGRKNIISGIGVDVEENTPLPKDTLHIICDQTERYNIARSLQHSVADPGKIYYCAKEAFYKSVYPLTGIFFDFLDVQISLSPPNSYGIGSFTPAVKASPDFLVGYIITGRWTCCEGFIFAGATVSSK